MAIMSITSAKVVALNTLPADSVYLFSYAADNGRTGLRLAYSENGKDWKSLGVNSPIDFVKSDFGPWGSHKTMFDPVLKRTDAGWRLTWFVSGKRQTVACADSRDFKKWSPQQYADIKDAGKFDVVSTDSPTEITVKIGDKEYKGQCRPVERKVVDTLLAFSQQRHEKDMQNAERMEDDSIRFADLKPFRVSLSRSDLPHVNVSPDLFGIFFEDINYGADGGLYAELIQNRDFEYKPNESGTDGWGPAFAWSLYDKSGKLPLSFSETNPLHPNNKTYLSLSANNKGFNLENSGFDGINLKKDNTYRFSFFVRLPQGGKRKFTVCLLDNSNNPVATQRITVSGNEWGKYSAVLKPNADVKDGHLRIVIPSKTDCDIDMVSLFPSDTYKGRPNGLRRDLAETLEALKPKFVRFPGGCVAHGNGIDNIYDWKGSVGALEERKPLYNLWGYHQTRGLGYHEFLEFCEDIGASPLPVLSAGVPCQNSGRAWCGSTNELTTMGQQNGMPDDMLDSYIQDILDLIEYCNGSTNTTWGALRAKNGHPEPFNLKYLGIGNEDMITEVFEERFRKIYNAVRKAHPDIQIVGTVGPFFEGTDYDEGWRLARELHIPIVDEHYYVEPGWLINNQDYYDDYSRGIDATKVYLGEYASHVPGRKSNMETALSTALYLTAVERNSDIVAMTSYAPLLAKKGHTQWRPDLIYFDNDSVNLTTDYYIQKLYGNNQGDKYLPVKAKFDTYNKAARKRVGVSLMNDSKTGAQILKLVNANPVAVTVSQDLLSNGGEYEVTSFYGEPADEQVVPMTEIKTVNADIELPPYSFMVIKTKK